MTQTKRVTKKKAPTYRKAGFSPATGKSNGEKLATEWDILKADIQALPIESRAKAAIIKHIQIKFGGKVIYVRGDDARKEARRKAVLAYMNENVSVVDCSIAMANRWGIKRENASRYIRKILSGDI